ncbi:class I SAM-dependent methyltransferase [Nocardia yamanashiensis]|uniref:class I SAM-dependent methyltransferase n=1 Tax=Nocardia yamanashiensis TaxID=209247 RepID=UPI001E2C48F9|nr:class I SAM-dependent methyltransferase [Nocardia yamanashiensis]UGT42436.1 class I SAM-dependent methyltransferase [Nocardia yamanashiensis]
MPKLDPQTLSRRLGNRHDYIPAAGFDFLLPTYDLLTRILGAPAVHAEVIAGAAISPGQRILDIGCGTGNLTLLAKNAHPDADLTGCDPDALALARAHRKAHPANGIRFDRAYAQDLPYPDAAFDQVLTALMLHHLDLETQAAAAYEMRRILRPGGGLHIADVHADRLPRLLEDAGLICDEITHVRQGHLGTVTYIRARSPR